MSILDKMHFRALNGNFEAIAFVDDYDSMIWSERFSGVGDFEVHGAHTLNLLKVKDESSYIFNSANRSIMIVENPKVEHRKEDGKTITITGQSLESVLNRRIIFNTTTALNSNPQTPLKISTIICNLVYLCFGPADPKRHWAELDITDSTPATSPVLPINTPLQFNMGENLLDLVTELCIGYGLGFRMEFNVTTSRVNFIVYEGVDRTLPGPNRVVFSDSYDNLLTASDSEARSHIKNTALVVGNATDPDTEIPLYATLVGDVDAVGLSRREMYYATDQEPIVYLTEDTSRAMTPTEYTAALARAGIEELSQPDHQIFRDYEGRLIESEQCKYGKHFGLGDTVVLQGTQTWSTNARLEGVTFSHDEQNGRALVPDFTYGV